LNFGYDLLHGYCTTQIAHGLLLPSTPVVFRVVRLLYSVGCCRLDLGCCQ